jgi:serine/threonine-protein kinase
VTGTVAGFELLEQLGEGAHGVVHRARRVGGGRFPLHVELAVKRLRLVTPDSLERLSREATALAGLDHPHVLALHDVVDDGPGLALVTGLARGGSWAGRLATGPVAPGEVVRILSEVADALASAADRGLVHGDVKPANILLTSESRVLLGDFGTARWLTPRGPADRTGEAPGRGEGSAPYVAPEVRAGAPGGSTADVHALGVCAYVALTGRRPDPSSGVGPLADRPVSSALLLVVEQAVAADPAERFPGAAAFAAALSEVPEARSRRLPRPAGLRFR